MKKLWIIAALLVVILVGGVACASNATPQTRPGATPAPTTYPTKDMHSDGSIVVTQAPPMVTVTQPQATFTTVPNFSTDTKGESAYYAASADTTDRMVVRNAYLTLVVDDVKTAMDQISTLAAANGGFVVNSSIQEDSNRFYASIAIRVDSTNFDMTIQALHDMAVDVKMESTSGQDVTSQYVDLDSQLRNLQASEDQLLKLMQQTGDVSDILQVQQQLTSTRGQIEQIQGQMQYLKQSADLAMFSIGLEQSKLSVEFTADTRSVQANGTVNFNPTIAGGFAPYSYEWDFGDGSNSTESNPYHVYHKSGTFTVTVTVTDDKGKTDTYTRADYINVLSGWSGGSVTSGAVNALAALGHGLVTFFVYAGIFSPVWVVVLLVILYFAWWRRRKKAPKA